MFLGFGAVLKTARCSYAGKTMVKMSVGIEGGISAFRIGQGVNAVVNGQTGQAWAYFGDATLRLLGLSAIAISWLKKQPICFVAGTPVHVEGGTKPIEEIQAGDRVWAFDRQSQTWRLCAVAQTFHNISQGTMATVVLSNGDEVTGTDGHPVWVIEGEGLAERGLPDHGADEPDGPTPGRWVSLGELQLSDAVLTRAGPARVRGIELSQREVPVYNLEVEELHCYAVGSGGLLAHNTGTGDCHLPEGNLAGKNAATTPDSPEIQTPQVNKSPEASQPGGQNASAQEAPPSGSTLPTSQAAPQAPGIGVFSPTPPSTVPIPARPGWNEHWSHPEHWNGPVDHGGWTGPQGNSSWIDDRTEVIRIVGLDPQTGKANPIHFYKGEVDFSPWSRGEFIVPGLNGNHAHDMPLIREEIARRLGLLHHGEPSRNAAIRWLNKADDGFGGIGLRPHHAGGDKVQLIPMDVHKVQHTDMTH